jgi:LemA protein
MFPIILIIIIVAFVLFVSYNSIVMKRNATEKAFATLDAVLKKRYDILPNVVASVQQSMQFESGILEKIVSLRNATANTNATLEDKMKNENELSSLLSKVLVTVENYPDLKSNDNISQLQRTIIDIEEDIVSARDQYNAEVLAYNNQIETIPGKWVADEMKATRKNYFETIVTEKENLSVKELFNK